MDTEPTAEFASPASGAEQADPGRLLPQLNQRLLQLTTQVDDLHAQVSALARVIEFDSAQITALVSHLSDAQSLQLVQQRLAEFTEQIGIDHEQLTALQYKLTELSTQEQLVRLATTVASQEQIGELTATVTALVRAQDTANHLGAIREEQFTSIIGTLQEIMARREQIADQHKTLDAERTEALRRGARGEMAADLLPALDGLEIALERGRAILARQKQELALAVQWSGQPRPEEKSAPAPGLLDKLRSRLVSEGEINAPAAQTIAQLPESMAHTVEATEAWLRQFSLVRDRFIALMAAEGIQPIPTLKQKFDPSLHLAVESVVRPDVPADTIVREVRRGYRQDKRVLRYAEVVVARAP